MSAIIREGHRKLLSIPSDNVAELIKLGSFIVPTSEGAWWASAEMAKSVDSGGFILHIRCRSWLNDGMITRGQLDTVERLITLREGDTPLGSTLLHPMVLRRPAAAA